SPSSDTRKKVLSYTRPKLVSRKATSGNRRRRSWSRPIRTTGHRLAATGRAGLSVFVRDGDTSRQTVEQFRYIAIEGPLGVGKAALADRLGARLDAAMVLDEGENPFLADFYGGRPGAAFQTQLFFTLARHRQQAALRQSDLFSQVTVCDYLFERDKIYAYLNLDDNELFIYQRLY